LSSNENVERDTDAEDAGHTENVWDSSIVHNHNSGYLCMHGQWVVDVTKQDWYILNKEQKEEVWHCKQINDNLMDCL